MYHFIHCADGYKQMAIKSAVKIAVKGAIKIAVKGAVKRAARADGSAGDGKDWF